MEQLIKKRIDGNYYTYALKSRGIELTEAQKNNIGEAIKSGCDIILKDIIEKRKSRFGLEVFSSEELLDSKLFGRFSTAFIYINAKLYQMCSDILNETHKEVFHIGTPGNWMTNNASVTYKK